MLAKDHWFEFDEPIEFKSFSIFLAFKPIHHKDRNDLGLIGFSDVDENCLFSLNVVPFWVGREWRKIETVFHDTFSAIPNIAPASTIKVTTWRQIGITYNWTSGQI